MKKVLFWCTFPLTSCLFVLSGILECIGSNCSELCHLWERWCFGTPKGMKYLSDGWYISKEDKI